MQRSRQPWMVFLCLGSLATWSGLTACSDDGSGSGDGDDDGASDADSDADSDGDADSDADADADSDADSDADADADSDADGDFCADYPASNNNFAVNSVIRNYGLWDKTDAAYQMCQFGGGQERLLFLAITATT